MSKKGKLIVFEGLDFTGKTTISTRIADLIGATYIKFPEAPELAEITINPEIPKKARALAHVVAHALSWVKIRKLLQSGANVVLDRYWWSNPCYAHSQKISEYHPSVLQGLEFDMEPIPYDIMFVLDASRETAEVRSKMRPEKLDLYDLAVLEDWNSIRKAYLTLAGASDNCIIIPTDFFDLHGVQDLIMKSLESHEFENA